METQPLAQPPAPAMPAVTGFQAAQMKGRSYLRSTIGAYPGASAAILAVLVVLILILAYYLVHYKAMCPPTAHKSGYEGLHVGRRGYPSAPASGPPVPGPCGPGETAVTYTDPDSGTVMTYCRSTNALPGPSTVCGSTWDPAATAEAQALATVGSLEHDSLGERRLQRAINAAYDSNAGLSDDQLASLMHNGGTP